MSPAKAKSPPSFFTKSAISGAGKNYPSFQIEPPKMSHAQKWQLIKSCFLPVLVLPLMVGCLPTAEEARMQVTSTPVPTVDAISEENGGVPEGDLWSLPSVEETAVTTPDTINIVELASLRETVSIEVCKLDCASYTLLCTVNNPELIADLIDLLDTDLPLNPHTCCPAAYQLRFILVEGRRYDFGYACQLATPAFLRGNQAFLQDRDAVDPDAFNALMPPLIDLSCPASVSMHGNRLLAIIGSREEKDLKPDV